ncbi:potassium channel family protein [Candidatus Gracilibacteria bacterium]|nr:potassium channel family protein [Candidatus Gracilibacteria bacterium]
MRFFRIIPTFLRDVKNAFRKYEFQTLFSLTAITLILGTVFYHLTEKWSWIDSFYFSVMTLTTVGYGDLAPTTNFTKIMTVVYIFSGLGILFSFVNAIGEERINNSANRRKR